MFPSTVERVPVNTAKHVNQQIQHEIDGNIERYRHATAVEIDARLSELEHEWDIERTLEANAAAASLIGLTLGATVDRRWYLFPAAVAGFLLQHALQGWCPPVPVFRRLGFRTANEIDQERFALLAFRDQQTKPRGRS